MRRNKGKWLLVAGGWGALWARSGSGPGAPDGGIEIGIGIGDRRLPVFP